MAALVIDGKALSKSVRDSLKAEVATISNSLGRSPALAVMLVGENPASQVYVRSKSKKAKSIGIEPIDISLPATISDESLQKEIQAVCGRDYIDGLLLQLPLPKGLSEQRALEEIKPSYDVDGLTPYNQGLLLQGRAPFAPCTPLGCIELIKHARRELQQPESLEGLHAVVVGRSLLVGKPLGLLLLEENCTVTLCHSRTVDLAAQCQRADILVAAVGRAALVQGDWVKSGAIVIDVGINRSESGQLVGDVDFASASERAAAITPVPGGVGPMTIAMLLRNTVRAASARVAK